MKKKKGKSKTKVFTENLLNLFFPQRCVWCGRVVGFAKECGCKPNLARLVLPGRALPLRAQGQMDDYLEEAYACFEYTMPVSGAIIRLKFEDDVAAATPLGQLLAAKAASCSLALKYNAIVPVPVSPKTRKKRGYNQSYLLAQKLEESTGLPVMEQALLKTKETKQQMRLTKEERLLNVQQAYAVPRTAAVAGKRILLVDDVLTTGATLNECAKTLLQAGAVSCGALCLACVSTGGGGGTKITNP